MPLLTDNCLARIKAASHDSIVDIIRSYIPLRQEAQNFSAVCPFHDEKTPSFRVSPSKHIFKCFGCDKSGDALAFIMEYDGVDFQQACIILASKQHIPLEYVDGSTPEPTPQPPPQPKQAPIPPPIHTYKPVAAIGSGLSPSSLDWFLRQRSLTADTLQAFGITEGLRYSAVQKQSVNHLCFPYRLHRQTVHYKFRAKNKDFSVLKGIPFLMYNLDAVIGEPIIYIVEGETDTLTMHQCGFTTVVGCPNASDRHFLRHAVPLLEQATQIYLCGETRKQDGAADAAGLKLRADLIDALGESRCLLVDWPVGCKDANDVLVKHGPEAVKDAIRQAQPAGRPSPLIEDPRAVFPFHIFSDAIQHNFRALAAERSIPLNYLGTTALWTLAALSGNVFTTELNGDIKNIIYALLVGPSGVGKTPAYDVLCGDIVADLEVAAFETYQREKLEWELARDMARIAKQEFTTPPPRRHLRTAQGGTMEGILYHAQHSAAGFGLYYDEGGKMFASPNAYKKDNSSTDFWNEIWNGKPSNEIRADESRERFVSSTSISVIAGLQTDRVFKYFDADSLVSGLAHRFLITTSDYIPLNTQVNPFGRKHHACEEWRSLVRWLFQKGLQYKKGQPPVVIPFQDDAAPAYTHLLRDLIVRANAQRLARRIGNVSEIMTSYDAKLYKYVGRFLILLAILDNPSHPMISVKNIQDAYQLYLFYREEAERLFSRLIIQIQEDGNDILKKLYEALPDEFSSEEAGDVCERIGLTKNYFHVNFGRYFDKKKLIKKKKRGFYEKI